MTTASLKALFQGITGSLILAGFFLTFIALEKVVSFMPLFIAFNSAITGYKIVEILKKRITNIPLFSFVLGIGGGAVTFVIINAAMSLFENVALLNISDLLIYLTVAGITSYLGAKLAVRYFNL